MRGGHTADRVAFVDAWIPMINQDNESQILDGPLNMTSNATETKAYGVSSVMAEFALKNEIAPASRMGDTVYSNKRYTSQDLKVGDVKIWNPAWKSADVPTVRANRKAAIEKGFKE